LLLVLLVTACSSSTSKTTQAPGTTPAPGIPQTGKGTQTGNASNQVTVTLADNTIQSSMTNFQAGVPYTFVITNTGKHSHNFNINPPVSTVGSLDVALNNALLAVPTSQLGPGQSTTEQFTFPASAAGKPLEFSCLIKRHYEDGMKLSINVVK
jgi:uncharacterized cupredoxin-like copper-binding protein